MMTANEIRASFLRFFSERGHRVVPSSPVIPVDDPTLLFTNAGMNQFKDVFLGTGTREYKRAVDSQKCIRVSGKHNDLEEVGKDTYHHTFFEMLGNWSFGDYYKREAILWAWELLTKVWNLPKERLWATVFETDDEAEELWREVTDIDPKHILRFGAKENFWEMGETGPCGPCSEIHFDKTPEGAKPSMINYSPDVIEIWNLVFIQYNRNSRGELEELPAKHVDTGMGLERIVAILQGKRSNYDTDLFVPLIRQISTLTGKPYRGERNQVAMRVISDHVRALSFAIADGALPSNEGRGYVLRRLLRRASRYARQLDAHEPILHRLVPTLAEIMGNTYPEVREKQSYIERVIRGEEENFIATLDRGMEIFDSVATKVKRSGEKIFPGDEAFKLYDTFGFPLDLTQLLAREQGLTVDLDAFEALMALQRERAREALHDALHMVIESTDKLISREGFELLHSSPKTEFIGYDRLEDDAIVIGVRHEKENELVILDKTPFYVEAGGQVDDTGLIGIRGTRLKVVDVIRSGESIVHVIERFTEGALPVGEHVHVAVDWERRRAIMRNHSATHLLHAALRKILGAHVHQAGSLVEPSRLRFDFTHFEKLDETALQDIETLVNEKIRENIPMTHHRSIPFDEAKKMGALMFFGEKYGDRVNIVQFGDFSMEFCGGTHVASTGDIGYFKIISEGSIASGVRRIEAITGRNADELIHRQFKQIEQLQHILNAEPSELVERVSMLLEQRRRLEKELADLRFAEAKRELEKLVGESILLDGLKLVTGVVSVASTEELKNIGDALREQLGSGIGVLASVVNNKVSLVCVVTDDLIRSKKLQAGKIVSEVAKLVGGGGGGRAHLATAGGKDVNKMNDALRQIPEIIRSLLKGT
ncbi:MAG: alanine--tRNA ligase [Bacteroidota bacterium]